MTIAIKEMTRMKMMKRMIKEMVLKEIIRLFIEKVLMIKWKEIRLKIWKVDFCKVEIRIGKMMEVGDVVGGKTPLHSLLLRLSNLLAKHHAVHPPQHFSY